MAPSKSPTKVRLTLGVNISHVFVATAGAPKATVFFGVSDLKAP